MSQKLLQALKMNLQLKVFMGKISFVLFPEVEIAVKHISQEQLHCMFLPEEQFCHFKMPQPLKAAEKRAFCF